MTLNERKMLNERILNNKLMEDEFTFWKTEKVI
jgi:hypothetical protein